MPALLKHLARHLQCCGPRHCESSASLLRAVVFAVVTIVSVQAKAQTAITTDEAIARAQQQVPGKLVAVTKEPQGDQIVYRVRILGADGVVRTVFVNASR